MLLLFSFSNVPVDKCIVELKGEDELAKASLDLNARIIRLVAPAGHGERVWRAPVHLPCRLPAEQNQDGD